MYNNNYIPNYMPNYLNGLNQQNMYDNIDTQINKLQQLKEQMKNNSQQQPSINQTFQLAPNSTNGMKYVNSIDDVNKETVFMDTPFFSKDLTVMWVKNANGNITAYELNEIVARDEKDIQIALLQSQIDELKRGMSVNEQPITNDIPAEITTDTSRDDEPVGTTAKTSKSTSVSRVSASKKK